MTPQVILEENLAVEVPDAGQNSALSSTESVYNRMGSFDPALRQFGYGSTNQVGVRLGGNVGPTYILGAGDQISIMVWGDPVDLAELPPLVPTEIGKSGGIFFAPVGLVPAAGQTLADVEKVLTAGLAKKYKRFELRLAVSQMRQFPVQVAGFVQTPGQVAATGGFGIFELLNAAGGILPNGSLRALTLRTRDGSVQRIDLYSALIEGTPLSLSLREGDSLFVPPLGATAAVAGAVLRPAIYEVLANETLEDLVRFAGGGTAESQPEALRLASLRAGRIELSDGSLLDPAFSRKKVSNGMLLEFFQGALNFVSSVVVEGKVQNTGRFLLPPDRKLSTLLPKLGLRSDTDLTQAQRISLGTDAGGGKVVTTFVPADVLLGKTDLVLSNFDQLRFFQSLDVELISVSGEVETGLSLRASEAKTLAEVLGRVTLKGDPRLLTVRIEVNGATTVYRLRDLLDSRVIAGIPVLPESRIQIEKLDPEARLDTVELTGQVLRPGVYVLSPGMRLSDLLLQAGGLREGVNLAALEFSRLSVGVGLYRQYTAIIENLATEVTDLETLVAATVEELKRASLLAELAAKKQALNSVKEAQRQSSSRVNLLLPNDIAQLKGNPRDVLLEKDDRVFVPPVPSHVTVLGSVNVQAAQAYVPGMKVAEAVRLAGGILDAGDERQSYLVRASGITLSAKDLSAAAFRNSALQPGDTVVIGSKSQNSVSAWTIVKEAMQVVGDTIGTAANTLAILKTLGVFQ